MNCNELGKKRRNIDSSTSSGILKCVFAKIYFM